MIFSTVPGIQQTFTKSSHSKLTGNPVTGNFILKAFIIKPGRGTYRKTVTWRISFKCWSPPSLLPFSHFLSNLQKPEVLIPEVDCTCWHHGNDLQWMLWIISLTLWGGASLHEDKSGNPKNLQPAEWTVEGSIIAHRACWCSLSKSSYHPTLGLPAYTTLHTTQR